MVSSSSFDYQSTDSGAQLEASRSRWSYAANSTLPFNSMSKSERAVGCIWLHFDHPAALRQPLLTTVLRTLRASGPPCAATQEPPAGTHPASCSPCCAASDPARPSRSLAPDSSKSRMIAGAPGQFSRVFRASLLRVFAGAVWISAESFGPWRNRSALPPFSTRCTRPTLCRSCVWLAGFERGQINVTWLVLCAPWRGRFSRPAE